MKNINVLFIGNLNSYGRSSQRYKAMQELGYKVSPLSPVPLIKKPGTQDRPNLYVRIRSKLGYPPDRVGINRKIIKVIKQQQIDIIWVEKGLMIRADTLKKVKNTNSQIVLAFYSEDDMYAKHNQSVYFRRCLPLYDFVFTTKSYNVHELPEMGARQVIFVDKAYDRNFHRPLSVSEEDKRRLGSEVIFVGNFEDERADYMLYLAENGIKVRIWGNNWQNWKYSHSNLLVEGRPIYLDDYVKALCASKIALCFLRKINRDLQTDRTMEIPACGTFMLAERTTEHLRLFEENKEAIFFDTRDELLAHVRYYLQNSTEREEIARAGRKRCEISGYSHHDRLKYMFDHITNKI